MRNTIIASALMLFCYGGGAMAQKTVTIKGTVSGDLKGYNHVYLFGKGVKTDTAVINNGSFEITIPFEGPMAPQLYDEYAVKGKRGYRMFSILIDRPGVVYLKDVDITKGLSSGTLSGMKSAEEFQEFIGQQSNVSAEISKQLQKKYTNGSMSMGPKSSNYQAYMKDMKELNQEKMPIVLEKFVKEHPDSYASAYILGGIGRGSLTANDLEKTYKMLSKNMQQSEEGKIVSDYLKGLKNSVVGQYVKDFTLNTPEDKPLDFNQLKGKYVLIDFWASWCGPCKASFPHMKELYEKYKSDKFEIYSISIDQSKSDWLKEVKKQDLPWLQTLDTKNIALSSFAVSAVPTTYMIDPSGKIIMKEIGFGPNSPMEKKLIELFGDKSAK